MKLSQELKWRGFVAETTVKNIEDLDTRENKQFYLGADPSADSLTIGNLAALMMCACFVRHGYKPTLLAGGATGQIGDPKENGERELKPLEEIEHNKKCIAAQMSKIISVDGAADTRGDGDVSNDGYEVRLVDNYDWFKDISYLSFLREVGKAFSMTQLLDRKFIQNRIGEGGSGISYAEFSYTLIQGYDFLHLYREYGISLQLCGADQYGNCASGIHLIRRLENAEADVWSTPLVIDPVTGRKFGKSEGNAVWLAAVDNGSGNYTPVFDFYQFWLNQADEAVEKLLKIYTVYDREFVEDVMRRHAEDPSKRLAQRALADGVTAVVHGRASAEAASTLTDLLFGGKDVSSLSEGEISSVGLLLPVVRLEEYGGSVSVVEALVNSGLVASKNEARKMIAAGAISVNGEKVSLSEGNGADSGAGAGAGSGSGAGAEISSLAILKRGKNKFALVR